MQDIRYKGILAFFLTYGKPVAAEYRIGLKPQRIMPVIFCTYSQNEHFKI